MTKKPKPKVVKKPKKRPPRRKVVRDLNGNPLYEPVPWEYSP